MWVRCKCLSSKQTGKGILNWLSRFSSVSWVDISQHLDITSVDETHFQTPTQYDRATEVWGDPALQAARLRESVNTPQQTCFSLWKDLCSINPNRSWFPAAALLRGHLRGLWQHVYSRLDLETIPRRVDIAVSILVPLEVPWELHERIREAASYAVGASPKAASFRVIKIDFVNPMDVAILNALEVPRPIEQRPRGSVDEFKVFHLVLKPGTCY